MAIKINGATVISDSQAFTSTSTVSASGNITGGNIATGGSISATGNIAGGNIIGNVVSTGPISTTGNVTGGNVLTGGIVSATGNITGGNVSATNLTGTLLTASQTNITSVGTLGSLSVTGTVTGGNLATAGTVSATGNIAGGNVLTGGLISATSTITSAANITGANILTSGLISATGNVTGGNLNISGNIVDSSALTISTGSGDLNLAPAGNVNLNNRYINGITNPVQNQDAATKIYVDNAVSTAISYHQPVLAATTTDLATATGGTITYNNGTGGVGANIVTTGSFNLIDTANVQTANTRILVKNEANAALNGVYVWSNATVITRSSDTNSYGAGNVNALGLNDYFFVSGGNVNKGSAFVVNAPTGTITFGSSNITFAQFSSSQTYTANTSAGISLNGTVINAKTDGTTTAFDGGGNIIVKASATLTTPNIGAATGTSLNVTGNVDSGNLRTTGVVSATGNATAGNILTAGIMSSTGNGIHGNVLTGGLISATGAITGAALTGTSLTVSTGNITAGNLLLSGAIVDSAQLDIQTSASNANIAMAPNGTGLVTVSTQLSAVGNVTGGNIRTAGLISATGQVTGSQFNGSGAGLTSIPNGALANSSVTVNGTAIALGSSGTVTANAATLTGTVLNATVVTSSLTSVGTLTSLNSGAISSSGNVTGTNILTAGIMSSTGNGIHGNVLTGGLISATGAITGAAITGTSLTVSTGNITCGNIVNANGNGVGNIGSSTTYFNTVFAKATSAQYADLAEKYTADAEYEPGTVVMFGGAEEVTACTNDACRRVAGVISTNPSYIMNGTLEAAHVATVALTGRVPTKVSGTVRKGDLMVSAGNGAARAEENPSVGTVIGKALADFDGTQGVIEVVVGRF